MQRISTAGTAVRTAVFSLLALAIAVPAWAQTDAPDEGIDEIIVTATKREQSIQDVPLAISAFAAEDLTKRGVEDLQDLAQVSPSLQLGGSNSNSNGGVIRIRGMGTSGNNIGLESAVGVFIDGIFRSRAGQAFQDLVDLERVEVLRGPQGTLFGKNTSAGALNIITKKPSFDFGGNFAATVGSQDEQKLVGSVTGPIIEDVLAFRLAASYHKRDGYYKEFTGGKRFNGRDRYTIKGQLLYTPTEDFDLRVIADYTKQDESCCPAAAAFVSFFDDPSTARLSFGEILDSVRGAPGHKVNRKDQRVGLNFDPKEVTKDWGVSAEFNYDMDWATVTGLFSYREFDSNRIQDVDFTDVDILQPQFVVEPWRTWTVELRAAGTYEDILEGFDWLVGVFSSNERVTSRSQVTFGSQAAALIDGIAFGPGVQVFSNPANPNPPIQAGTGSRNLFKQETRTYAFFSHNTLYLTEDFDLTVGVRYTLERKGASQNPNGAPFQPDLSNLDVSLIDNHTGCFGNPFLLLRQAFVATCDNFGWKDSFHNDDWSFFASLGWAITDEHRAYFSFAHGFKSGGWNSDAGSLQAIIPTDQMDPAINLQLAGNSLGAPLGGFGAIIADGRMFDPEFTNNFELGLKSRWMDGRLTVNTAIFHTEFINYQLNTFTGLFFRITNVPLVKARGVEVEGTFAVTENIITTFGVTYADTRYGDELHLDPGAEEFGLQGNRINGAPAWSGSFGFIGNFPILDSDWDFVVSGNVLYRGRRNTGANLDPRKFEDAFYNINAQFGFESEDRSWSVMFWGENLTDTIVAGNFDSVFQLSDGAAVGGDGLSAFVSNGRLYGLTVTYRFGDE